MSLSPRLTVVALASLLRVAGCDEDDAASPVEPVAAIAGTVTLRSAPDPLRVRAAAYAGVTAFDAGLWTRETGVVRDGAGWAFDLPVDPGEYYVDVWMDADSDGQIGAGDAYGYYAGATGGAPATVQVESGRRTVVAFEAEVVPAARTRPPAAQSVPGKFCSAKSQSSK